MITKTGAIWYSFCRLFCKMVFAMRWKINVQGEHNIPRQGGCILLCNHQSYFDPPLCGVSAKRRLCYVARDTLFNNKYFGGLIRSTNAIPIKRDSADISAMKLIIEKLKEGEAVLLFPESTRSPDGKIAGIKAGFGLLSRRAKVPVLPVLVDGTFEVWPRNQKYPSAGTISVVFGELISAERVRELGDEAFSELLTRELRKMQHDCRIAQGKAPYSYSE